VVLPKNLFSIGDSSFWGCPKIENINLKSCKKLKIIYDNSFCAYAEIKDLNLDENIKIELGDLEWS